MFVKICGLTKDEDVRQAVAAGADALGFVFADSPRRISVAHAAQLSGEVPSSVIRVAVMRNPTPDQWIEVRDGFRPDWLQMEAANFGVLGDTVGVRPLPVYRDTPALDETAFEQEEIALFEGAHSGRGQIADWDRAARLASRTQLLLAGGLDPENVAEAIASVHPWGVDVSSGVESARGVKDPQKIEAFIDAVRNVTT